MAAIPPPRISNSQARHLLIQATGLGDAPRKALRQADLAEMIGRMGFVQLDSINTLERAHHQILFARNQTYRQHQLSRLLEKERGLFENWTHDASVIPVAFYPFWQARFERERERLAERWRKWQRKGFEDHREQVLERIAREGPLMARDFGEEGQKPKGGWWDWHPEKTALEYLWRTGELAVAKRDGFQKVYDLTERVIPEQHRAPPPEPQAFLDWKCRSALERLLFATPGEIAGFWGALSAEEAARWCKAGLESGELTEVELEGAKGVKPRKALVLTETLDALSEEQPAPPARLRLLSPFDPLLRDRARAERLFGFSYRIEVFVPEAKRQYGYYVFPLLEGERLVGRIDLKHERDKGDLVVKGLWWEKGVRRAKARLAALEAELERQRKFTGAERLVFAEGWER
jgi:uncharacterized protein YcaQ